MVVGTVEQLVDIGNNIDNAAGRDHIQDIADNTVGTAADIVAVADTTVQE